MHAKLLIRHRGLTVCWVTAPYGHLWRKSFEMTAERQPEKPDSVNTSPFGILESGGLQHSMWKPRSHESQKSISSWKRTTDVSKGRPCWIHTTLFHHLKSFGIASGHLSTSGVNKSKLEATNPQGYTRRDLPTGLHGRKGCVFKHTQHYTYSIFALYSTGAAGFAFNALPS